MARFIVLGAILLALAVVRLNASEVPKHEAPGPQGRITDEAGRPLPGAKVILYGGYATRWKIAEAATDADGRYRFDAVQSSMIKDDKTGRWDQYVGIRVEHPTHVEADGKSWRDIRIPGVAGHVETLDLKLTPGGHVDGLLKDKRTGEPLKDLNLRLLTPTERQGRRASFLAYATTDGQGRFHSISLFPGDYDLEVNSTTLDYPVIGRVKVEAGRVTAATFDDVTLPRVIRGRVVDADGKPLDDVQVTLVSPKDSGFEPRKADDFITVRTRAWTIYRPKWEDRFELAFLPGLEGARFVLAVHKERGWARAPVEGLERGEPIRLRPWKR